MKIMKIFLRSDPRGEYPNGDVLNFGDLGEIHGVCGSLKTVAWSLPGVA